MITHLPPEFFSRLCVVPRSVALRELDRELQRLSSQPYGNAQIIPFRTKSRRTISEWPQPPVGGAA